MTSPPPLPQPLEVDNIPDIWTVLTAIGTFIAAIGTVAVFWLAYVTYRRQVDERTREYASRVTVYVNILDGEIAVENLGDLPVYSVVLMAGCVRSETIFETVGRL